MTEHPSALTDERERHYERLADRLEAAGDAEVASVHYLDARDFRDADAVVLSGSFAPWAAHDPRALARLGDLVRGYGGPVLGICAGMQLQALFAGGRFAPAKEQPETGFGPVEIVEHGDLFRGLPPSVSVYKHHSEEIVALPDDFRVLATSAECAVEAISAPGRRWWGTQFHPEEFDREHPAGERVLRNFFELAAR